MEMLSSLRGDKHEFCLTVINRCLVLLVFFVAPNTSVQSVK